MTCRRHTECHYTQNASHHKLGVFSQGHKVPVLDILAKNLEENFQKNVFLAFSLKKFNHGL
jgi:hypothetical protein